jgi:hypothetical protein
LMLHEMGSMGERREMCQPRSGIIGVFSFQWNSKRDSRV